MIGLSSDEDHFYYTNRITFDEFLNISDNVIKTSACLASPLNKLADDHPMYMRLVNHYDYLEVQPHTHPEQIEFNRRLLFLSEATGKPLIAGTDTHNSSSYKSECRAILLKRKKRTTVTKTNLILRGRHIMNLLMGLKFRVFFLNLFS